MLKALQNRTWRANVDSCHSKNVWDVGSALVSHVYVIWQDDPEGTIM